MNDNLIKSIQEKKNKATLNSKMKFPPLKDSNRKEILLDYLKRYFQED